MSNSVCRQSLLLIFIFMFLDFISQIMYLLIRNHMAQICNIICYEFIGRNYYKCVVVMSSKNPNCREIMNLNAY